MNPKTLYLILVLNAEAKKSKYKDIDIKTFKPLNELAHKISNINKYFGYLAWSEVYLSSPETIH